MGETGEHNHIVMESGRKGINPPPLHPEKPFAANREIVVREASDMLSSLPHRRASSIREAIKSLTNERHHFSLVDMIESEKPVTDDEKRRRLMINSIQKNAYPSPMTTSFDERRKIWEMDPERFASEIERDDARRLLIAETRQRLAEETDANIKEIIADRVQPHDPNYRMSLRELSNLFDPVSGKIIVPASYNLSQSELATFYDNNHKIGFIQSHEGKVELRGRTYYAAKEYKTDVEDKIRIIQDDMDKVLGVVSNYAQRRQEISNPRDYLMYLGILDLMKHHSITLFHTLTYNERKLKFPTDRDEFYAYQERRQQALGLMRTSVRMYYQTLFGKDYDEGVDLETVRNGLPQLTGYIRNSMLSEAGTLSSDATADEVRAYKEKRAHLNNRFTNVEVNNPFMISLGVQEAVKRHPDTDMIVGIPSGGTETAFVTQLVFEHKTGKTPQLVLLPLAFHSKVGKRITTPDVSAFLGTYYRNSFDSKKILLVDDSSETGKTLGMAAQGLLANHAEEVSVHVLDLSTRRLTHPIEAAEQDTRLYYRPNSSPTTLGLTPLDENGEYAHNSQRSKSIKQAIAQSQKPRW